MKINKEIKVVDHPKQWFLEFQEGWLHHYDATGDVDWSRYNVLTNEFPPFGEGIDRDKMRLMLISVAGGYDRERHAPFDDAVLPGDLSVRNFFHPIEYDSLAFTHARLRAMHADFLKQAFFPIGLLEKMQKEGQFAGLVPETVSVNGEIPNVLRVEKELLPKVMARIEANGATAALLIPGGDLSVQTAMLLARGLELYKIPSVLLAIDFQSYEKILPPRIVFVDMKNRPEERETVRLDVYEGILMQALTCLTMDAPVLVEKK